MDDPRSHVTSLIMAAWTTQVIRVAVRLGLPEIMAEGEGSAAAIARETGADPSALRRLMRAMAGLALLQQLDEDRFALTQAGRLLTAEASGSVRGLALHWGERLWGALSQLDESVRTGRPWRMSGQEGFEAMARDPGQMDMFHQSMADQTRPAARAILEAYDFSRFSRVIDVGGSYGALLATVLEAHPKLTGQVFDLPDLANASSAYLESAGLAKRASFVGGSFFEAAPPGADAYMLKTVIHDWGDEDALAILKNCRVALGQGAVVLVIERIAPELASPEHLGSVRGDILMLTAAGGVERTEAEYRELLAKAGLEIRRVVPTASDFSVIEAAAAG